MSNVNAADAGHRRGISAYDDPGTPEEITRRTFMVNATMVVGGLIGLGLAIPIVGSLIPDVGAGAGSWTPLNEKEFKQLQAATDKPVSIDFTLRSKDSYLPEHSLAESVWGIKTDLSRFEKARPDLFGPNGKANLPYQAVNMGFVIFSPICPHLGCRYDYHADTNNFACPCHGSQFDNQGKHTAGPAARGLDPLPLRERSGEAQITWIRYAPTVPDRIVVSYKN
ncbi:MAG: ubiquinol-cytochrome c reductase iron-sulfur subunit [Candidatus Eremiobacteraeota bacterium]|nr:ubiquinol-cytochrome c reductase iron-sulfur subunit [Candidatus Eremiobacteraeota bacterium]